MATPDTCRVIKGNVIRRGLAYAYQAHPHGQICSVERLHFSAVGVDPDKLIKLAQDGTIYEFITVRGYLWNVTEGWSRIDWANTLVRLRVNDDEENE